MTWQEALKRIKAVDSGFMREELKQVEDSLNGWMERDEDRERGFQHWREYNVKLRERNDNLLEALTPFALFAAAYEGRDDILTPVAKIGVQAISVGAFQSAKEAVTIEREIRGG